MCRNRLFITLLLQNLADDPASADVPIDNLSMVVLIIHLYIIFKKKLSAKSSISIHITIADTYLCFYGLNLKFTNLCNFT